MKILAILSQKGGAGKTTLALHIAVAAEAAGKPCAVIDLDPQASAAAGRIPAPTKPLEAVAVHGIDVAPVTLQQRAAYGHALTAGQSAPEYEPQGKAAAKVADLRNWLFFELKL